MQIFAVMVSFFFLEKSIQGVSGDPLQINQSQHTRIFGNIPFALGHVDLICFHHLDLFPFDKFQAAQESHV